MIIQSQFEYVKEDKFIRQSSYERIVNSKFIYPKPQSESHVQNEQYDTVNFQAQAYFKEADRLSHLIPLCEPHNNPLNKMYLTAKGDQSANIERPIKQAENIESVDDLNRTYYSLNQGEVVLLDEDHKFKTNQFTNSPFLTPKRQWESAYQSPVKYSSKALFTSQKGNKVVEIQNPNVTRRYLTNLKTHLIHKVNNIDKEDEFKTRFEHIDNQLYKQREAKYNPGFKEPFKADHCLRQDAPEKQLGPKLQLRFVNNQICDQSKISLIDDQTKEQLSEETFMKEELTNLIKDQEVNRDRKKWNMMYKLDPITTHLKPNHLRRKHEYRSPILDQTSFLINDVSYDKEFEGKMNPLLCQDKQQTLGDSFSHRFSNNSLVQFRKGRSMSRNYPYNRGIFEITQKSSQNSLNNSFY